LQKKYKIQFLENFQKYFKICGTELVAFEEAFPKDCTFPKIDKCRNFRIFWIFSQIWKPLEAFEWITFSESRIPEK
jgi:hypothetical protein